MSLALAIVMCIGLLAACGGDNSKTPDTQAPGTTTPDTTKGIEVLIHHIPYL